jgi:hypothetical protein
MIGGRRGEAITIYVLEGNHSMFSDITHNGNALPTEANSRELVSDSFFFLQNQQNPARNLVQNFKNLIVSALQVESPL